MGKLQSHKTYKEIKYQARVRYGINNMLKLETFKN